MCPYTMARLLNIYVFFKMFYKAVRIVRIVSCLSPTRVLVTALMLAWSGTIPNN